MATRPGAIHSEMLKAGAKCRMISLAKAANWPREVPREEWWQNLRKRILACPSGLQKPWGIPFRIVDTAGARVVMVSSATPAVTIPLGGNTAGYVCLLHAWSQMPEDIRREDPMEGLVVAEYELTYADGSGHVQPVRARFEVPIAESPGPAWTAQPFNMPQPIDPTKPIGSMNWGMAQYGFFMGHMAWQPMMQVYALPNPKSQSKIRSITIRGLQKSPFLVSGITLYEGESHPLRHLPRRSYRVANSGNNPAKVKKAEVDLGLVVRTERTQGRRGKKWTESPHAGLTPGWGHSKTDGLPEDLLEIVGAEDASVSLVLEGRRKPAKLSLGEAFHKGRSVSDGISIEVLGKTRQWMQVRVTDASTGKPTPTRIHFSGGAGEYIAPYGHHSQINGNWFEDYGADVIVGGQSFAYVHGEFTTELPVGDLYVEIYKGFEYKPVRQKVTVKPGQRLLELSIERWKDLRSAGWVTADTHVHFVSPHTAWLEAQCEGVNIVNLLASQWGRLFTNVGDLTGRVGVVENDTIVYVGTENRNHMLGHMSMLGTQGSPVYPMCCGGTSEAWIGDPDYMTLTEWAEENRKRGGVVIRPHFPACGNTEDPVPIIKGLMDAVEITGPRGTDWSSQEWYRYLNNGYRVAVVGGADKMSAGTPLGWTRTYAKIDPNDAFDYDAWAKAVRAGRTISTTGPLIDLSVDGFGIGESIEMPAGGGTVEVRALGEGFMPLGRIEIVCNGKAVAEETSKAGAKKLEVAAKVRVTGSGWIAARCQALQGHPAAYAAAHTSPVYVKCGETRAFSGPAMQHLLALVEGGMEYIQTLSTRFDTVSHQRILGVYDEARRELKRRLETEGGHHFHHGAGGYHVHGFNKAVEHKHR